MLSTDHKRDLSGVNTKRCADNVVETCRAASLFHHDFSPLCPHGGDSNGNVLSWPTRRSVVATICALPWSLIECLDARHCDLGLSPSATAVEVLLSQAASTYACYLGPGPGPG
eukprot:m.290110 g.290110  ORF g.290110 m.290110 type:complete len:113 (+) comp27120_c0_seq1:962-1300(+)